MAEDAPKGHLTADSPAFCQWNEHRHVGSACSCVAIARRATRTPSQPSSLVMARWSCRSARASCATKPVPKTRFRPYGLSWCDRARSIRVDDSLGGWLHGVAYRVAVRARADSAQNDGSRADGRGPRRCPAIRTSQCPTPALVPCTKRSLACPSRCGNPSCCASSKGKPRSKRPRRSAAARPPSGAGWHGLAERLRTRLERKGIDATVPVSLAGPAAAVRRSRHPARRAGRRARLPPPCCVRCHAFEAEDPGMPCC